MRYYYILLYNSILLDIIRYYQILYADDTKIWREIIVWDDHLALQNDIDNLLRWANINKMTFHPQKCKVVSVAKNSFEPILPFQLFIYELGGTLLDYASSEKDLGVIVNTTLTFDDRCNDRYSTMNQKLGLLRRVCYFTKDQKQKRTLFLAIVRSQLNHCCVVWGPANDSKIDRLECVQKKAVKWILNEQYHHVLLTNVLCQQSLPASNEVFSTVSIYYGITFL